MITNQRPAADIVFYASNDAECTLQRAATDKTGSSNLNLDFDHGTGINQDFTTHEVNYYDGLDFNVQFGATSTEAFLQDLGFNGAIASGEAVEMARQASANSNDTANTSSTFESVTWTVPSWTASDTNTTLPTETSGRIGTGPSLKRLFASAPLPVAEPLRFSQTGYLGDMSQEMALLNTMSVEPAHSDHVAKPRYPDPEDMFFGAPYDMAMMRPVVRTSPKTPERSSFADHRSRSQKLRLDSHAQKHMAMHELTPSSPEADTPQACDSSGQKSSKTSKFSPARPKKSPEHPWVRSSGSRQPQGTARTGKINNYNPEDHYVLSTRINKNMWQASNGTRFEYNKFGELDRSSFQLSINDMEVFLSENPAKPVLWIQTCPADSARRYNTAGSSKCRFKDCPASVYKNTIAVGILRVAIDEAWPSLGVQRDPFHCAGFMHLYCAERFLDWRAVCSSLHVRVDDRVFNTEPNGRLAASLLNTRMADVAAHFLKYARYDARHSDAKFLEKYPNYPPHILPAGPPKDHSNTLTHAMMLAKIDTMTERRLQALVLRGERGSHMQHHLGDLQQAVTERRAVAVAKKRKREAEQLGDVSEDDDEDGLVSDVASLASGAPASRHPHKQRRVVAAGLSASSTATKKTNSRTRSQSDELIKKQQRAARRQALAAELARLDAASDAEDVL